MAALASLSSHFTTPPGTRLRETAAPHAQQTAWHAPDEEHAPLNLSTPCCSPLCPCHNSYLDCHVTALQAAVVHHRMGALAQHYQPALPVRHKLRRGGAAEEGVGRWESAASADAGPCISCQFQAVQQRANNSSRTSSSSGGSCSDTLSSIHRCSTCRAAELL